MTNNRNEQITPTVHATYMSKANRDQRAKELRALGYRVKCSSMRGQNMHPMYIADWPEQISREDRGFGNTIYRTYFKAVYTVNAY